jgi:hypothetical protein
MCRAGGLANLIQQLQHVSGEERQEIVHGSFEFKIRDRVNAGRQDGDGLHMQRLQLRCHDGWAGQYGVDGIQATGRYIG